MVGWNWFLPESPIAGGSYPLVGTYQGQPCCSLAILGQNLWETSLAASGLFMFRIAPFPVRVEISGGVSVEVSIGARPEAWRRNNDAYLGNGLESDQAIFARVYLGSAAIAEAWSEWAVQWGGRDGTPDPWMGDAWQLGIGWTQEETVYVHFLPYSGTGFMADNLVTKFTGDFSRDFGTGMSFGISLPGVYQGPSRIRIASAGTAFFSSYNMPCSTFTGHVSPLMNKMPFLPDAQTVQQKLEESPSARFGCLTHVARALVAQPTFAMSFAETDFDQEWAEGGRWKGPEFSFGPNLFGPKHLAAMRQYRYSDHAAIPAGGNVICNLSPVAAENDRLTRLRIKWTIDKKEFQAFGRPDFAGQFVFEADVAGHGAWGEWGTMGWVPTNQKATVPEGGGSSQDFFVQITAFSVSLNLTRHTLANNTDAESAKDLQRDHSIELRTWLYVDGRIGREQNGQLVSDSAYSLRVAFPFVHLRQADANALFAGQKVVLATPYSPDGLGHLRQNNKGTLEITGLGPP